MLFLVYQKKLVDGTETLIGAFGDKTAAEKRVETLYRLDENFGQRGEFEYYVKEVK